MKKIKDERLIMKNLQNIKVAYIIQTLGIIGILAYDLITKGLAGMRDNPLWYVFIITSIISAYLSMNISVDHENSKKDPKKGLSLSITIVTLLSVLIGILIILSDRKAYRKWCSYWRNSIYMRDHTCTLYLLFTE